MSVIPVMFLVGLAYILIHKAGACVCPDGCVCLDERYVHCARVYCRTDNYTDIPDKLPGNTSTLHVNNKNLEVLQGDAFIHMISLRRLDLSYDNISVINVTTFKESKIQFISLAHNFIEDIDSNSLSKFTFLKKFDISYNQLSHEGMDNLLRGLSNSSVESIHLSNNNVQYLRDGEFEDLHLLQAVYLSFCKISNISESALLGSSIKTLYLDHNKLTSLPFILPNTLISIDISHNNISTIKGKIVQQSGKLQSLNLSSCRIQGIVDNAFDDFTELQDLRLANNRIQAVPTIPETVEDLDLSFNQIQRLLFDDFKYLYELRRLSLAGNNIHSIESNTFIRQCLLTFLDLRYTNVSETIIRDSLVILGNIVLNQIPIIDLSYNEIKIIPTVSNISINLSFNRIQTINARDIFILSATSGYDLSNNPFDCTFNYDIIDWIWNKQFVSNLVWIVTTNVSDGCTYKCASPSIFNGYDVLFAYYVHILSLFVLPIIVLFLLFVFSHLVCIFIQSRWMLRLAVYRTSQMITRLIHWRGRFSIDDKMEYDAYLSYAECDEAWVREHILPGIDNGESFGGQFRLYLDCRDATPGTCEFSNMIDNIDRSRIAIIILTKNYISDCKYEYELNYIIRAMYKKSKDNVLVIKIGNVAAKSIPKQLYYYMETGRFLSSKDEIYTKILTKSIIRHLKTYK